MTTELRKEPLVSFVVPVYKVDEGTLLRCVRSLIDQDYNNMEIITVFDGVDPKLLKCITPYLGKANIKVLEIEHGGACAARNRGFEKSKGEIVSFFNSDYVAKAGMVRMWVDELEAHPDCGFLYGPYEYAVRDRSWYASKAFDPWQLEQANYIDCGFPLWRKHVVEWDVNCKSLQDWDFWLRVVKGNGQGQVKGYFLDREISFVAEPPRPDGLSVDSHNNWPERVKYVREKNNIKTSDIVVTSIGARTHGVKIAQLLGADFRDDTIDKKNNYKALYMIGYFMKPSDESSAHANILHMYEKQIKIVHFIGADIYWLRKFTHEQLKYLSGALNLKIDHILCETSLAQKELSDMGIKSKIVPISPYNDYEYKPLPEKFTVGIFLTDKSDFDKYCFEKTLSIVRAMPDINFKAYGDAGQDVDYPNLTHAKNMEPNEWKDYVYSTSCLLRIVQHDTRPLASDEFIMAGRNVITNVPVEKMDVVITGGNMEKNEWDIFGTGLSHSYWPETKKSIVQRIRSVRDIQKQGNEESRKMASQYTKALLDKTHYINTIKKMAGV